jgi:hypothetical protein
MNLMSEIYGTVEMWVAIFSVMNLRSPAGDERSGIEDL